MNDIKCILSLINFQFLIFFLEEFVQQRERSILKVSLQYKYIYIEIRIISKKNKFFYYFFFILIVLPY